MDISEKMKALLNFITYDGDFDKIGKQQPGEGNDTNAKLRLNGKSVYQAYIQDFSQKIKDNIPKLNESQQAKVIQGNLQDADTLKIFIENLKLTNFYKDLLHCMNTATENSFCKDDNKMMAIYEYLKKNFIDKWPNLIREYHKEVGKVSALPSPPKKLFTEKPNTKSQPKPKPKPKPKPNPKHKGRWDWSQPRKDPKKERLTELMAQKLLQDAEKKYTRKWIGGRRRTTRRTKRNARRTKRNTRRTNRNTRRNARRTRNTRRTARRTNRTSRRTRNVRRTNRTSRRTGRKTNRNGRRR